MSFNPRMSTARAAPTSNQRNRQQDESDAFMTLVGVLLFKTLLRKANLLLARQ